MQKRIGIRKENKDLTEKRAPLAPKHIEELVKRHKLQVVVEPSTDRIFSDGQYKQAGAAISNDLSGCNIIFGVKETPIANFLPQKAYCFFSHTIKGQPYNMPMLKRILDLRITLIDYERVINEAGERLIFFGNFAGYAGMVDSLWALGKRLEWEGIRTPFALIEQALNYSSLEEAKNAVKEAGKRISREGLPQELLPFICGFTGYGQVSQGAQEIFNLLPSKEISPHNLAGIIRTGNYSNKIVYKVVFKESDLVKPKSPDQQFELQDYYDHPENYQSVFNNYLPYLSVLINGIYWEPRYPRLVTKSYLREQYRAGGMKQLKVIGDITCDIDGSIECTIKATNTRNPVYVFEPLIENVKDGWAGEGPVILAVDKLPSELPREASHSFGEALLSFVPALAQADYGLPIRKLDLPKEFRKAVIAHGGRLAEDYRYLQKVIRNM
jgi:alanine dehydrogenase